MKNIFSHYDIVREIQRVNHILDHTLASTVFKNDITFKDEILCSIYTYICTYVRKKPHIYLSKLAPISLQLFLSFEKVFSLLRTKL